MTDKYAVIGNPISHSKSPQIHRMFAEQTGQDISYEAIESPLDGFALTIERLRREGYKGCNVTVPFKHEAFRISTKNSQRAQAAEAVNTLMFVDNEIIGDNTDGVGLVADITKNIKYALDGKRVLLAGAGGAADGVAIVLSSSFFLKEIKIANRTVEKAQHIENKIKRFIEHRTYQSSSPGSTLVSSSSYPGLETLPTESSNEPLSNTKSNSTKQYDLVINTTSLGLSGEMPPLPPGIFAPGALAYDMMYGRETPFMKFARMHGARVADGLGMLVEQAAEAFFIWRGVRPDTAPVIAALREQ